MRSILVYGPQGSGKSHNAETIRKYFGLHRVVRYGKDEARKAGDLILADASAAEIDHAGPVYSVEWVKQRMGSLWSNK